jgi:hypothetical protein
MDTPYITYVEQRIINKHNPNDIIGLKIPIIYDDFKNWYCFVYGNNKGLSETLKGLKQYMENIYGKYPSNGWSMIKLSDDDDYDVNIDILEELKIIQKLYIKISDVNMIITDIVKLKTSKQSNKICLLREEITRLNSIINKEPPKFGNCHKCIKKYVDCICFD